MNAFYIFSFYPEVGVDTIDYDWFVGKDEPTLDEQETEVANHIVEEGWAENYEEALEMLKDVYKQDNKFLIERLSEK